MEKTTEIIVSPKNVGELKSELPEGKNILMFLCINCGTYIKREFVAVGDTVFDVNLISKCKCGNSFILAIKGVAK